MSGDPVAAPPPPAWYLDTSAVTKLVVPESESAALAAWCDRVRRGGGRVVIGDLVQVELLRTLRRHDPDLVPFALGVAARFDRLLVTRDCFERAASIAPPALRTLDALHLATALRLGVALAGLVTYDDRLAGAADLHGIARTAPGWER